MVYVFKFSSCYQTIFQIGYIHLPVTAWSESAHRLLFLLIFGLVSLFNFSNYSRYIAVPIEFIQLTFPVFDEIEHSFLHHCPLEKRISSTLYLDVFIFDWVIGGCFYNILQISHLWITYNANISHFVAFLFFLLLVSFGKQMSLI